MKKLTLEDKQFRNLPHDQRGLIPLLLAIFGAIALIIFFVFTRVAAVNQ